MNDYATIVQSANKQRVAGQWVHTSENGQRHAVAGDPTRTVYTRLADAYIKVGAYRHEHEYETLVRGGVADGKVSSRALFTNRMGNRWALHGDPECMVFLDRSAAIAQAAQLEGDSEELADKLWSEEATAADHVAYYNRNPLDDRMVRWMGLGFGIVIWVLLSIVWDYSVTGAGSDSLMETLGRSALGMRSDWYLLHFVMPFVIWFGRRPLGYVLSFIIGAVINLAAALYRRV